MYRQLTGSYAKEYDRSYTRTFSIVEERLHVHANGQTVKKLTLLDTASGESFTMDSPPDSCPFSTVEYYPNNRGTLKLTFLVHGERHFVPIGRLLFFFDQDLDLIFEGVTVEEYYRLHILGPKLKKQKLEDKVKAKKKELKEEVSGGWVGVLMTILFMVITFMLADHIADTALVIMVNLSVLVGIIATYSYRNSVVEEKLENYRQRLIKGEE